ncbi:MAG: GGDEF domain-containing protein [Solirubrobacterales bacterium]
MSFGKRLALFFVLIALVPTLALVGILVLVNEDSRRGKADASLAAGVKTALALHQEQAAAASPEGRALSGDPQLSAGLESSSAAELSAFAARAVGERGLEAVEVRDALGKTLAAAGNPDAVAWAPIELTRGGEVRGGLAVSVTSAQEYASEVARLTGGKVVLSRDGVPLVADVPPPAAPPAIGETKDLEIDGADYRGHLLELSRDGGERLLLLGPARAGDLLGLDSPAFALLAGFLLLGMAFAYGLARTLTFLHDRVSEQALTDSLTGLWNRREMLQRLAQEVDRAQRFGHELSMLVIDIDNFKRINDSLGHPQGDEVLKAIADTVRETTRSIDVGARYGGDELALILLETGPEGALILAERLRERIEARKVPRTGGGTMDVTVSIGVATLPYAANGSDELIEAADQALLRGKRSGKNQTRVAPHLPDAPSAPRPRAETEAPKPAHRS